MDKSTKQGLAAWLVCVGILFGVIAYGSGAMSITSSVNGQAITPSSVTTGALNATYLGTTGAAPGLAGATNVYVGSYDVARAGIWLLQHGVAPTATNYAMVADGSTLTFGGANADYKVVASNAASGQNAFQVSTNGARIDFGAGANDYFDSDGTNITAHTTVVSSAGSGVNALTMNDLAKLAWSATTIQGNGTQLFLNSNGATMLTLDRTTPLATTVAGSALSTVNIAGTIFSSVASTGNGGTCASGVDLIAYTLPANTLTVTNRCIRIKAWGITANNATAKNIDLALGAGPTILVTKALNISLANETWDVSATICRSGSSAQTSWAEAFNNAGTTVSSVDGATVLKNTSASTPNFTESSSQSIRVRCITNANAANDIVEKGMTVEYL